MGLSTKKSMALLQQETVEETGSGEVQLRRTLTATNLVLLGIGAIIGAGIFVLTGTAAANYAGPAIVISFILAGLACTFAGLCYAEFASMIPIAGSAYTYGYATLGEFVAWIIGWDLILEYLFAASTVAVGWSANFVRMMSFVGVHIPVKWSSAPFNVQAGSHALVSSQFCVDPATGMQAVDTGGRVIAAAACAAPLEVVHGLLNVPAILLCLALTVALVIGIRESANLNNVIVFIKMAIVLLVIGFGFAYVNSANWHPFIPPATGNPGEFGWGGIARAAGVIFFAYIGFDAVSTAAQEAKNPQKDLPVGILGSLAICTVLYILMSLVITGLTHYSNYKGVADPIYVALDAVPQLAWLKVLTTVGTVAGLASVVLVMLMGQPRIFFAMARDGLLPPIFGRVHPKYRTPWLATIITGIVAAMIAGLFPIGLLGELVSIGTLLAFVIVCAGILALRRSRPELPRPFRTPFVPLVPILGILSCGYLMYSLPGDTWLRLMVWMAIGIAIYFLYGRHHSKAAAYEAAGGAR